MNASRPDRVLPGYWTPQELAAELKKSPKWVLHRIKGRDGRPPELKAYCVSRLYFVPDLAAEAFLKAHRGELYP